MTTDLIDTTAAEKRVPPKRRRTVVHTREEHAEHLHRGAGGFSSISKLSGRLLRKTIEAVTAEDAKPTQAAVANALQAARMIQESTPEFKTNFEPGQLSPQQIREYLLPTAKAMILQDVMFREQLLADPEVQASLRQHLGITVIQAPRVGAQEGPPDVR